NIFRPEVLAEVWSNTVIATHAVVAEYIPPSTNLYKPNDPDEQWKSKHVRQSQYCLQIVKCDDINCCSPLRTNLKSILSNGFLPPPILYKCTNTGINYGEKSKNIGSFGGLLQRLALNSIQPQTKLLQVPFDYYCPTVEEKLTKRTCEICGLYLPSKTATTSHNKIHRKHRTKNSSSLQVKLQELLIQSPEFESNDEFFVRCLR
ncbi:unnamed protein product, partial [Rotaria sordida]